MAKTWIVFINTDTTILARRSQNPALSSLYVAETLQTTEAYETPLHLLRVSANWQ